MATVRNIDRIQRRWRGQGRYPVGEKMSPEAQRVLREAMVEIVDDVDDNTVRPEDHVALAGMKRGTTRFEVMVTLAREGKMTTYQIADRFGLNPRQSYRMLKELLESKRVVVSEKVPIERGTSCNAWEVNDDYERV